jgi:hypothetical protein
MDQYPWGKTQAHSIDTVVSLFWVRTIRKWKLWLCLRRDVLETGSVAWEETEGEEGKLHKSLSTLSPVPSLAVMGQDLTLLYNFRMETWGHGQGGVKRKKRGSEKRKTRTRQRTPWCSYSEIKPDSNLRRKSKRTSPFFLLLSLTSA